jgi:hypothetical protein
MSDSKPCPALELAERSRRRNSFNMSPSVAIECATCPNRKPVSLEELVKRVREHYLDTELADMSGTEDSAFNSGIATAVEVIRAYEKELNNG